MLKPFCRRCGSAKTYKNGTRKIKEGKIQQWMCLDCQYGFIVRDKAYLLEK